MVGSAVDTMVESRAASSSTIASPEKATRMRRCVSRVAGGGIGVPVAAVREAAVRAAQASRSSTIVHVAAVPKSARPAGDAATMGATRPAACESRGCPIMAQDLDLLCINTIRTLAMDAVQAANSGHPGTPMALAPVAYALWQRVLRFDCDDPIWPNRDRFVLSAGH